MKISGLLRKIFAVILAVAVVLISPIGNHSALAARGSQGGFGGGDSPVEAYRKLQKVTYDYRNQGDQGEGRQDGRMGNRSDVTQRTGRKLQDRMDNRRDLTSNPSSVQDAAKNLTDNTQNAFKNAGEKVRDRLSQ